jgi:hypothetical protein
MPRACPDAAAASPQLLCSGPVAIGENVHVVAPSEAPAITAITSLGDVPPVEFEALYAVQQDRLISLSMKEGIT